jgi:2',3'-cyclic-nucleotide 2'-phosphodiesterase (5'-nucleotidase family)
VRVEKTGAVIVQAGDYARYVGRLEVTVDLDTKKVVRADGGRAAIGCGVVEMKLNTVPCDETMVAWVKQREQGVCPGASRVVGRCEKALNMNEVGFLAAAALRQKAGADIGFCHPGSVIRSGLPKGDVDMNALFLTGGARGHDVVTATLTGKQIDAYLRNLRTSMKGQTTWAGFQADMRFEGGQSGWKVESNLDPERSYRVVMPETEWDTRLKRVFEKEDRAETGTASACDFSFIDALVGYVEPLTQEKVSIDAHVEKLMRQAALKPVASAAR